MDKHNGQNPYNDRLHEEAAEKDRELMALAEAVPVSELARRLKVSRSRLYFRLRRAQEKARQTVQSES